MKLIAADFDFGDKVVHKPGTVSSYRGVVQQILVTKFAGEDVVRYRIGEVVEFVNEFDLVLDDF